MKLRTFLLIGILFGGYIISGLCHDVPVHFNITIAALNGSSNFFNFMQDNDIDGHKQFPTSVAVILPPGGPFTGPTASGLIEDGSVWEDNNDLDQGGHRSLNHFYDPTTKKGLYSFNGLGQGLPSVIWATQFMASNPHDHNAYNEYTWQNARRYQSNAITSTLPYNRDIDLGDMFRSVGHVAHLLEDTSQPQHVRNEQHWDGIPLNLFGWESAFEDWGRDNIASIRFPRQKFDWVGAGFTCVTNFWDTGSYNGKAPLLAEPLATSEANYNAGRGSLVGLAEFCNGNFLTVRGNYPELAYLGGNASYPFPSTTSTDLKKYLASPSTFGKADPDGTYRFTLAKNSQGVAVAQHCAIDLTQVMYVNPLTGKPGTITGVTRVHPDDPDVIECYHSILIPRAIAYSTGLINYYFRGRLGITNWMTNSTVVNFTVTNMSLQAFSGGGFRVFSDDNSSNRFEVDDLVTSYDDQGDYLEPFDTVDGSFTIPYGSSGNFTIAFFGAIGASLGGDGSSQPLDAVDTNGIASLTFTTNTTVITVPSDPLWTDTGLYVKQGTKVAITASGTWDWGGGPSGPDGDTNSTFDNFDFFYYPGSLHGALLAYVGTDPEQGNLGNGDFFPQSSGYWNVGSKDHFTISQTGELWLGFNDDAVSEASGDNTGSVTAVISIYPPPP